MPTSADEEPSPPDNSGVDAAGPRWRIVATRTAATNPLRHSAGTVAHLLGPDDGCANLDVHRSVLEAAADPGPYHRHPHADSLYYVLEGGVIFRLDGEERSVETHHLIHIRAGAAHSVRNPGPGPAVLLGIYAPPGDDFLLIGSDVAG